MVSLTNIWNGALIGLGQTELIVDPNEASQPAKLCREKWESVRDATLEDHPWNFAMERVQLAALAAAPAFGFSHQYQLPAKPFCLKVRELDDEDLVWQVEGRRLLVDAAGPLNVRYTRRVTDTQLYPGLFVEAVSMHLAWKIAFGLTRDRNKQRDARKDYLDQLGQARGADGREGTPPERAESDFLRARG